VFKRKIFQNLIVSQRFKNTPLNFFLQNKRFRHHVLRIQPVDNIFIWLNPFYNLIYYFVLVYFSNPLSVTKCDTFSLPVNFSYKILFAIAIFSIMLHEQPISSSLPYRYLFLWKMKHVTCREVCINLLKLGGFFTYHQV